MLARKVKVGRLVRASGQVQPQRRRPRVAQPLDRQAPHLRAAGAVPHLLPRAGVHLGDRVRLRPRARVAPRAAVALRPLPAPQAGVGLRAKGAAQRVAAQELGDAVLDPVRVQDRHRPRGRAVVEGVRALVQRRRDGREGREDGRGVGAAGQERGEAPAVGLAAGINARLVDVVG